MTRKKQRYIFVKAPDDFPGKTYTYGNRVLEHHLVWWQHTGEIVPDGHVLHHKNEDQVDNSFENLELKTNSSHVRDHHTKDPDVVLTCAWCGVEFTKPARYVKSKQRLEQRTFSCCRSHGVLVSSKERNRNRNRIIDHGTYGRYRKGCRCDPCKAANTERHRKYREKRIAKK